VFFPNQNFIDTFPCIIYHKAVNTTLR